MGIRWPPRTASPLRLGKRSFGPGQKLIMAIVNRTPDSFYDRGATWDETAAMERVHAVVSEGADIVDIGGRASRSGRRSHRRRGDPADRPVRVRGPGGLPGHGDQRRHLGHQTARELCAPGADLLNDTWGC